MVVYSIDILDNEDEVKFTCRLPFDNTKLHIGRGLGLHYVNDIQLPRYLTRVSRDHCSLIVQDGVSTLRMREADAGR